MPVWKKSTKYFFLAQQKLKIIIIKCTRQHSWPCCNNRLKQSVFPAALVRMRLFLPVFDSCGRCRFTRCVWSLIKVAARCIWSPRRSPSLPLPSLSVSLSFFQMVTRTKKIFVGGLSANTVVEDVKQYFEQFGKVRWVLSFYTHFPALQSHNIRRNNFFFDFPICAPHLSYSVVIWLDQSGVISRACRSPWYAEFTFT